MSPPGHRSVLWVCTWRSGLHRARGITTKPVERSHIPTSDRLRNSRGLKTTATAQRFLEGFEAPYALRHGHVVGVTIGGPVYGPAVYPYGYAYVAPRPVYVYPRPYVYPGPVYYGRVYGRPYWHSEGWERHEYREHRDHDRFDHDRYYRDRR